MPIKLNHLHLKTEDPDGTAKFYEEVLGGRVTKRGGSGGYHMDLHGLELNISTKLKGQTRQQYFGMEHLSVYTDEYDKMYAMLKAKGIRILEEKGAGGKRAVYFEGPDGVQLEFIEKKF